jgi:hypothetical protein
MAFMHRGWMLLLTTPNAVLLLVWIGVLGCLWHISLSSWCIGIALRALMYSAPSSASAALDMTAFRILEMLRIAPLFGGSLVSLEQKKMSVDVAACFSFAEVRCITMYG